MSPQVSPFLRTLTLSLSIILSKSSVNWMLKTYLSAPKNVFDPQSIVPVKVLELESYFWSVKYTLSGGADPSSLFQSVSAS